MTPAAALAAARAGTDLDAAEMEALMGAVMAGGVPPETLKELLVAWRDKGEAVSELVGAARAMRACSVRVELPGRRLLDTCGTGGDGLGVFNVSTAAAVAAAACGATVAKHGNRAVSSSSGSADVLRAAGVAVELPPAAARRCIETIGLGFLFAPGHHPAMKYAAPVRREIGTRTLFNLLGPLTNPAGARRQLAGLFDARWLAPYAETLAELGAERALAVHGRDGMDELSLAAPTDYALLDAGAIRTGSWAPADFGLAEAPHAAVQAADPAASLALIRGAFAGRGGPAADLIALNAGLALHVAGVAEEPADGVERARRCLRDGAAAAKLAQLAEITNRLRADAEEAAAG